MFVVASPSIIWHRSWVEKPHLKYLLLKYTAFFKELMHNTNEYKITKSKKTNNSRKSYFKIKLNEKENSTRVFIKIKKKENPPFLSNWD